MCSALYSQPFVNIPALLRPSRYSRFPTRFGVWISALAASIPAHRAIVTAIAAPPQRPTLTRKCLLKAIPLSAALQSELLGVSVGILIWRPGPVAVPGRRNSYARRMTTASSQ